MRTSDWELRKLYAYNFFQMFLVIIPVFIPFLNEKGITLQEVFILQGIFGATLIIFDLPAGYLADLFGRRKLMVIGSVVVALGFQIFWVGETFWHFVIYEIITALGISLQSGCDMAILYNHLEAKGPEISKTKFVGRRLTSQNLGEAFAALLGGFLAGYSLLWPAYANACTAWIPVLIALSLREPEGKMLSRESHFENFAQIYRVVFHHSRLLTLAILCFIFYGFATYCAVWVLQPYWAQIGIPVSSFGILWALNSFFVALMSRYAHWFEMKLGTTKTVILIAFLPVVGYLGMGLTGGISGLLFTIAFPVCRGLNQVLFQDAINARVPSEMRATTNSIGSLGMRALFIGFGPLIGFTLDEYGVSLTLTVLGGIYFVLIFVLMWPLLKQRKNFQYN